MLRRNFIQSLLSLPVLFLSKDVLGQLSKLDNTKSNDGLSLIEKNGSKYYLKDGQLHNDNGPAVILSSGEEFWYKHGKLSRKNGPAATLANGTKFWISPSEHNSNISLLYKVDSPTIKLDKNNDYNVQTWQINGINRHGDDCITIGAQINELLININDAILYSMEHPYVTRYITEYVADTLLEISLN